MNIESKELSISELTTKALSLSPQADREKIKNRIHELGASILNDSENPSNAQLLRKLKGIASDANCPAPIAFKLFTYGFLLNPVSFSWDDRDFLPLNEFLTLESLTPKQSIDIVFRMRKSEDTIDSHFKDVLDFVADKFTFKDKSDVTDQFEQIHYNFTLINLIRLGARGGYQYVEEAFCKLIRKGAEHSVKLSAGTKKEIKETSLPPAFMKELAEAGFNFE